MTNVSVTGDFRAYLDVLFRRWKFVLAMPVLAMLAAALVTLVTRPLYEATAVIALAPATLSIPTANQVPPYYLVVDSPRRLPASYTPAFYIALLKGADVAARVSQDPSATGISIGANAGDKSLIEITARGEDPLRAAEVANQWAQAGVARIQQLLVPSGEDAALAQKNLDMAEQALVKFARENGLGEYDLGKWRAATGLATDKQLELERLLRARDNAEAVYNDFARELAGTTIVASTAYKPTAIPAAVPGTPVSPRLTQSVLVAAGLGLLVGVLGAFGLAYLARKR